MTYPASFAGLVRWLVVSSVTFSCFAKEKVTKKKATPVCRRCAVPCVARLVRRLRNSRYALRQSSPKSPDQPALLGGAQGIKSENQNHRVGTSCPSYLALNIKSLPVDLKNCSVRCCA